MPSFFPEGNASKPDETNTRLLQKILGALTGDGFPSAGGGGGLASMERVGTANDQQLTVDATAGGVQFTAFPGGTRFVVLDVQEADVRVTFDGSAPTTSNGHIMNQGDSAIWSESLAADAKFIRDGSVDAIIHATPLK